MAGFDLDVPTIPHEREVAKRGLHFLQCHARQMDVQIKYKWVPRSKFTSAHYYVTVDGSFPSIQALCSRAIDVIPAYCEGFKAGKPEYRKSRMGQVITIALFKAMTEFNEQLHTIVNDAKSLFGVSPLPNTFFFSETGNDRCDKLLNSLSSSLIQFENGRIRPEQLVETFHTVIEFLLKAVTGSGNRGVSFSEMAKIGFQNDIIEHNHNILLDKFKILRNNAKHKGQLISIKKVVPMVNELIPICHILVNNIR
jgi:hypothetical protein